MTLQHKNLLFYYPYPNIRRQVGVYTSKNHICLQFPGPIIKIYDKITFKLIYESQKIDILYLFGMYPFMLNIIKENQKIHVYYAEGTHLLKSSFPDYYEGQWYVHTFKVENQKVVCTIDPQLINTTYRAKKEVDYEAFFNQLHPKFSSGALSKARIIFEKQYFKFKKQLDYGFDIKKDTKRFRGGMRGGRHNNISIRWFKFPNPAKRPEEWIEGRIVAVNILTKKIIWHFDLELSTRQRKDYYVQKEFVVKKNQRWLPQSNLLSRTYYETNFFSRNVYVFNHNFELYGLNIETGEILWQRSNTFDLPIPYHHKGYCINLRGTYRIIDLDTGEDLITNKDWVKDEVVWHKLSLSSYPEKHIKIYDDYVVAYEFLEGNIYFYERTTGHYLFTINIQEQYWNCAVQLNLISQQEMEEHREQERWVCGTDFWDIYRDRLYIKFNDVFCVYDLTDFNESNEPQRIGESPRN